MEQHDGPRRQDQPVISNFIFGSAHSGGFNVAMCDSSVKLIAYPIDLETHRLGPEDPALGVET